MCFPEKIHHRCLFLFALAFAIAFTATTDVNAQNSGKPTDDKAGPLLITYTVFPLDPIELVKGIQVQGDKAISHKHHRFEYYFANEANRATFAGDPAKYEIQMGGACARMGALNTGGNPEIYTVYEHQIYLFASKACRTGFLRDPNRLLDRADEKPEGDARSKQFGELWLQQVVDANGGKEAIDGLKSFSEKSERIITYGDRDYTVVDETAIQFDGTDYDAVRFTSWDNEGSVQAVKDGEGYFRYNDGPVPMHQQQKNELHKMLLRNPLMILKMRNKPGFSAVAHPVEENSPIKYVSVNIDDTTTELGIEIETNRIVSTRYQGRGPTSAFGEIKCTYSDFKTVDGITVPTTIETGFDGTKVDDLSLSYSVTINKPVEWDHFE
jgi:YHS domain-containing protein